MRASTSEWIREISVSQATIDVLTPEVTDFPLDEGETEAEIEKGSGFFLFQDEKSATVLLSTPGRPVRAVPRVTMGTTLVTSPVPRVRVTTTRTSVTRSLPPGRSSVFAAQAGWVSSVRRDPSVSTSRVPRSSPSDPARRSSLTAAQLQRSRLR